jgi:hypothetical protein
MAGTSERRFFNQKRCCQQCIFVEMHHLRLQMLGKSAACNGLLEKRSPRKRFTITPNNRFARQSPGL